MTSDSRALATLTVLQPALDHPEGVAWGPDGRVYAGGEAGQIYRIDIADGTHEIVANTGGFVLGLALDAAGNVYACDMTRKDDWEQLKLIAPTNVAFGGRDMKTLVIANLCGTNLVTAPMHVAGLPVRYPVTMAG